MGCLRPLPVAGMVCGIAAMLVCHHISTVVAWRMGTTQNGFHDVASQIVTVTPRLHNIEVVARLVAMFICTQCAVQCKCCLPGPCGLTSCQLLL